MHFPCAVRICLWSALVLNVAATSNLPDETCLLQTATKVADRSNGSPHHHTEEHQKAREDVKVASLNASEEPLNAWGEKTLYGDTANHTYAARLYNEIQYEVGASNSAPPMKNKLILLLLEITIVPGFFGVDRCFMNQPCLGVLKALTFSGLGFWGLIDTSVVLFNSVSRMTSVHSIGFVAKFDKDSTVYAFYIGSAWFCLWALCCCCSIWCGTGMRLRKNQMPPDNTHGGVSCDDDPSECRVPAVMK